MKTKIVLKTTAMLGALALIGTVLTGCTKEETAAPDATDVTEVEGFTKAVGGRFINGTNGWDSFDVSNAAAELGEFEANIDNTGYVTIRTEGIGGMRVGDGGNYPTGVCDGAVPAQGGFRFTKGTTVGACGATFYITPRKSGNDGRCLKLRIKRGTLPALTGGQSWFTFNGNTNTWTANSLAGTYFCWSTQTSAPTPLCE